mgnify:CR=1 FL=1
MNTTSFQRRHIGPNENDQKQMLDVIGVDSLDQLINETIPEDIRLQGVLHLDAPMSEYEYLNHIEELSKKNKVFRSYIGLGYHEAIVPSVIKRNVLENPAWYTAYTPYQPEISQGRLEALFAFQTVVCDMTALALSNASMVSTLAISAWK